MLLYKPAGVLTATRDARQKTVLDLLPARYRRMGLFPAGRLDKDTTGLLILTNDGDYCHRLVSPRFHVPKVYEAAVDGDIQPGQQEQFARGLVLGDGTRCLPARLEPLGPGRVRVVVQEGKYHQVKRMLAQCGMPVKGLHPGGHRQPAAGCGHAARPVAGADRGGGRGPIIWKKFAVNGRNTCNRPWHHVK